MSDTLADTPEIKYPGLCPGCEPEFDSRHHKEAWCTTCRPGQSWGAEDDNIVRMRTREIAFGTCDHATDPTNQQAAGEFFRGPAPVAAVVGADET